MNSMAGMPSTVGPGKYRTYLNHLARRDLLPSDHLAVFLAGSRVRGWGNVDSDLDVYIICASEWTGAGGARTMVTVRPEQIVLESRVIDRQRWDIQYWLDSQVSQVLAKVSWEEFDTNFFANNLLTSAEADLLERLTYAVALAGDDWLAQRREQLTASAFRQMAVVRALHWTGVFAEDARGQLASDDVESSVLSARMAFGNAIRALLADNGKLAQSPKWFARQFREMDQDVLSFEEYWSIETMRTFDPANPGRWVGDILAVCDRIALNVTV
jgi:hypothetical protein